MKPTIPAELPKANNAHQIWVDILLQELKRILYPKSLESKDAYKVMSSKKSIADRCNKALQLAVDFENLRLKVVSNTIAQAHQEALDRIKALHVKQSSTRWWQPLKSRQLARDLELLTVEESALKRAFILAVNTPPPAPPAEGKTEEEMDEEIDKLVAEHKVRQQKENETRIVAQEPVMQKVQPCDQCGGTGYAGPSFNEERLCTHCKGSGVEPSNLERKVAIEERFNSKNPGS